MAALSDREVCLEIERDLNRLLLSSNNQNRPPDVLPSDGERLSVLPLNSEMHDFAPPRQPFVAIPYEFAASGAPRNDTDHRSKPVKSAQKPGKRDRRKNAAAGAKQTSRPAENDVQEPSGAAEPSSMTPSAGLRNCRVDEDGAATRGDVMFEEGIPLRPEGRGAQRKSKCAFTGHEPQGARDNGKGTRGIQEPTESVRLPFNYNDCVFLQDLERHLLDSQPFPQERLDSQPFAQERRRTTSTGMPFGPRGTERDRREAYSPPKVKLETLKQHRILPLKKKSKRFPRAQFYCHLCHRHFDDAWYAAKHMDQDMHAIKKAVSDLRMDVKNLPYPVDTQCEAISSFVEQIAKEHGLTTEEVELRRRIAEDLEAHIKATLPDVRLTLHGSSVNGFGLKTSNVDMDLSPVGKADAVKLFIETSDLLLQCPRYTNVQKDFLSKVPRIRFMDFGSKIACEISLNNCNSLKTSRLLDDYVSLDPRVQTLGVAFRLWAKICGLDQQEKGTLPAHAFAIMTVFFLQQCKPAVLPVLHEVKGCGESESYVKPKDLEGRWTCKNDRSVGQLWVELLRFYAVEFKLNKRVVCIRKSQPVLITEKKWNKRYIAIEDPYSSKRNLARSIPSERVYLFLKRCLRTSATYFLLPQLRSGPVFTMLPGPPYYRDDSESDSESEQEEDKPKGKKERQRQPSECSGGAKASDEDEGEEEEEDDAKEEEDAKDEEDSKEDEDLKDEDDAKEEEDASSDSSVPTPDMDEHDPEVAFEDAAKVIGKLDLGPDPATKGKGHKKKEAPPRQATPPPPPPSPPPSPPPPPSQQFVKPGPPIPQRILDDLDLLNVGDYRYSFTRKTLANGKAPPLVCSFCQKSGHLHEDCPDQRLPELKKLPDMTRSFTKILNDVCQDVMKVCSPQPQEEAERQDVLQKLETFIQEVYKDAKLTLYGSSCNGFGLVRSDLDICLTFDGSKDGKDFCHSRLIGQLSKKLHKHPDLDEIIAITTAKVPIVKFFHVPSGLEADISLYNTLAQHNTRLLKAYSDIDSRVRELGYTLKHFAKTCDIGDASRGSLSSYAYILMTLYYLQQCKPPVIPVLQELYPEGETKPEVMIEGWNAWFFEDIDRLQDVWSEFGQNNESVGELWLGMLRFYTEEFNFKEHVVCIRQKALLTRLQKMWTSRCIAIEDPFDLDHNLGSGVSRKMNTYIMKAFIKGRSLFGTPIRKLPAAYSTHMDYFFDSRQLTDGQPPNDRGCRRCGKIGHRVKECPRQRASGPQDSEDRNTLNRLRDNGQRSLWPMADASALRGRNRDLRDIAAPGMPRGGMMKNQRFQQLQPQQPGPGMLQRRMRPGPPIHQQPRGRLPDNQQHLLPRQNQQQQQQQQQRQPQQPKQPQQQQSVPPEGHPEAPPPQPPGGLAPPGVAQAQLQRALQDMMGAGLHHQVGGAKPAHCFAPPMATPPSFLAPPMRPPPFPGANGQAPPHPDVQNLLFRIQQQQQQQHMQAQPQDLPKRYGQWPINMPPPRHAMPWPPNLPHGQQEAQQHLGGFLGQRPPPPHGIPHPASLLPPPPHQQPFLCGPPSKPAFSTTSSASQPIFAGPIACVGGEQPQWDSSLTHTPHEVKSVPSQE